MRFTDVERNIIVASTDMPGLTKDRLERKNSEVVETKPHYSASGKGFWLWGSKGVYKDKLISKRTIQINTKYL